MHEKQNNLNEAERNKMLKLCEAKATEMGAPCFMPPDGKCNCGCDLIDRFAWEINQNQGVFITGCPSCHRSYCE